MKILFSISPTDPEEVLDLINLMELHKAVGANSIPTRILKDFKKQLSIPTSQLINFFFNERAFCSPLATLSSLRSAKVIPFVKSMTTKIVIIMG